MIGGAPTIFVWTKVLRKADLKAKGPLKCHSWATGLPKEPVPITSYLSQAFCCEEKLHVHAHASNTGLGGLAGTKKHEKAW